jgi:hypothetical protein
MDNLFGLTERQRTQYRDIEQRREYWEKQQATQREQRERDEAQAELESYLTRRGQDFEKLTGRAPSEAELAGWQLEYADAREREQQDARQRQLDQAAGQVF